MFALHPSITLNSPSLASLKVELLSDALELKQGVMPDTYLS